jgi:anti-sigma B factor antagonist
VPDDAAPQWDIDLVDLTTAAWSVTVRGELDASTAPRLASALDEIIDDGGRLLSVQLKETTFLDSSGLRVLVNAANKVADLGGQLFVEGASGAVQRVLEVTGVIERLRREE